MKKILVLGHRGMLGNAVYTHLEKQDDTHLLTMSTRWGDTGFQDEIKTLNPEYVINCIGAIPQKKPSIETYTSINIELPTFLETLGARVIHPSTDCEFSGDIPTGEEYTKVDTRDAQDDYGKSKAIISQKIENSFANTKIIRTSIIGHEYGTHFGLLDWFLSAEAEVKGYTDHYWNGITTLMWAELASVMITDWESYPTLNQFSSGPAVSKYEILTLAKEIYNKDITIQPYATGTPVNKCLTSDKTLPNLKEQLISLKAFYNK
jgi:dTDP-4-dehydrorhamnose reductase